MSSRYTNGQIEEIRERQRLFWATMPDAEREARRQKMIEGQRAAAARRRAAQEAQEKARELPAPEPVPTTTPLPEPPASFLADAVSVFRAEQDALRHEMAAIEAQIDALQQQRIPLQERVQAIANLLHFYDRETQP